MFLPPSRANPSWGSRLLTSRPNAAAPCCAESEATGVRVVVPSKGSEARCEGRHEVGATHITCDAGERAPPDHAEGRSCETTGFNEGKMSQTPNWKERLNATP